MNGYIIVPIVSATMVRRTPFLLGTSTSCRDLSASSSSPSCEPYPLPGGEEASDDGDVNDEHDEDDSDLVADSGFVIAFVVTTMSPFLSNRRVVSVAWSS